jgi:hypothetical protein
MVVGKDQVTRFAGMDNGLSRGAGL